MHVDRPALVALTLFGLLGLGYAVVGLSFYRPAKAPDAGDPLQKKKEVTGPEVLPMPRAVEGAARALHISVTSPGLAPAEVEQLVIQPLEAALRAIDGVRSIESHVHDGRGRIALVVAPGRDINPIRAEIINRIKVAASALPPDMLPPVLAADDPEVLPVLWIAIRNSETRTLSELSDLMRGQVRNALLAIPGVKALQLHGEVRRRMRVHADPAKLLARASTLAEIIAALEKAAPKANADMIKDLETLPIKQVNGQSVFLRDVATIAVDSEPVDFAALNGRRTVLAGVHIADTTAPVDVSKAIAVQLEKIPLPDDLRPEIVADASRPKTAEWLMELRTLPGTSLDEVAAITVKLAAAIRLRLPPDDSASILALGPKTNDPMRVARLLMIRTEQHALSNEAIQKQIGSAAAGFPGIRTRVLRLQSGTSDRRVDFPLRVRIAGNDREQLLKLGAEIVRRANEGDSGLADADSPGLAMTNAIEVITDRDKAAQLGITARDVMDAYEAALGTRTVTLKSGPLVLLVGEPDKKTEDLANIPLHTKDGKVVRLQDVATFKQSANPVVFQRFNGQRCLTITANPTSEVSLEKARANLRRIAEEAREKLKVSGSIQITDE